MLVFNLKIAFRNLRKNKVFSVINITGLAISMACCMVIALYVWNELHFDSFHSNLKNIYRITEKQNQAGVMYNVAVTPGPLAPEMQKDFPEITNTVRFANWSGTLKVDGRTYEENGMVFTDNSIFKVFDFPLLKGDPTIALLSPDDILISETTAEKYFGNNWRNKDSIIGHTITWAGQSDFKIAGIVKNTPANSSINFDILVPLTYLFKSDEWSYKWNSNNYHTYVQLKPGTDSSLFEKKISGQLAVYNKETKDTLQLQPLAKQYLYSQFDFKTDWGKRSEIKYIKIFSGVGLLLLLIACVNFVNLSTARSLKRSMEVGVRKVNGASRKQLIYQFLGESILLASLAGLGALLLVNLSRPWLLAFAGIDLQSSLTQPEMALIFLLFMIVIGSIAGFYPAFVLSSFKPVSAIKQAVSIRSGKLFRQSLVVFQFAASVTLITCVYFMYQQLHYMNTKDLGFDKEQIITVRLKGQLGGKADLFKRDLEKLPGVAAASPATMTLANVDNSSYVEWEGMQKDDKMLISQANVMPEFIPALGMKLVSGKNFSTQYTNDTSSFIINESAARRMGYTPESAIGKQVTFWGPKGPIIGVVKDFHYKPLNAGIEPFILRYQPQDRYFNMFVKVKPGKTAEVIPQIEKAFKLYEAELPFDYAFLDASINELYKNDNRTAGIILFFANLTIFVGCLGLFGLAAFAAEQRIKEISIRKVLGAGVASITGLLSKDFLKLVLIAFLIAIPAAWYTSSKWLENYVYRINIQWWVFALVGVGVLLIAFITVSVYSIKTAIANPVKNLRSE